MVWPPSLNSHNYLLLSIWSSCITKDKIFLYQRLRRRQLKHALAFKMDLHMVDRAINEKKIWRALKVKINKIMKMVEISKTSTCFMMPLIKLVMSDRG